MRIGVMLRHIEQQGGGIKIYTLNILPPLLTLGAQHTFVLLYQDRSLLGRYAAYPNVEEVVVRWPGTLAWDQIGVPLKVRNLRLDLIFNPKMTVPLLTGVRSVFMAHGSETLVIPEHFSRLDILYRKIFRPLYLRRAAACVAVSNTVKADLIKYLGAKPDRVFPVHNGYDPRIFHAVNDPSELQRVRAKYRLPERFLLWVGQIEARKNIGRLLQAFGAIKSKIPHSLVIAGERRRTAEAELRHIDHLGLTDRVQFTGWIEQPELAPLYALADALVFPSLYEGFGIPLLEAMACGCPIVAAGTGSIPEVLDGAGRLVDPLSVESISEGIRAVLSDDSQRKQMIAAGLTRAKDFSWNQTAQQLLAALERSAGQR